MARTGHLFEWPEHGPYGRSRPGLLTLEWSVQARQDAREGGETGKRRAPRYGEFGRKTSQNPNDERIDGKAIKVKIEPTIRKEELRRTRRGAMLLTLALAALLAA